MQDTQEDFLLTTNNKLLSSSRGNREQMEKYKTTSAVVAFRMIPINNMHQIQRHPKVGREKKNTT